MLVRGTIIVVASTLACASIQASDAESADRSKSCCNKFRCTSSVVKRGATHLEDRQLQDLVPLLLTPAEVGVHVSVQEVWAHLQRCQLQEASQKHHHLLKPCSGSG